MKESSVSSTFACACFGSPIGKPFTTHNALLQLGYHLHIAHHYLLRHTNKQSIKKWTNAIILKMMLVAWDAWTYKIGLGPSKGRTFRIGFDIIFGATLPIVLQSGRHLLTAHPTQSYGYTTFKHASVYSDYTPLGICLL